MIKATRFSKCQRRTCHTEAYVTITDGINPIHQSIYIYIHIYIHLMGDLNHRPPDYMSGSLTTELMRLSS